MKKTFKDLFNTYFYQLAFPPSSVSFLQHDLKQLKFIYNAVTYITNYVINYFIQIYHVSFQCFIYISPKS